VTVDPHLHRRRALDEIYTIPATAVHAAPAVAAWVRSHVRAPVIIGPDVESGQWVRPIAAAVGCGVRLLEKRRDGDRAVSVSAAGGQWARGASTPVLVDDIVSTARTMIETVSQLRHSGAAPPVCIGIHGIFADDAYGELVRAGAGAIVTTNSIAHASNAIDLAPALAPAVLEAANGARRG
jgi:ribose-phosphate pyrophosphokinase